MTALYLLAGEYRGAAMRLADMDLDAQTVADTLESLGGELEVKAKSVAMMVRTFEADAAAMREWAATTLAHAKAVEARAASLRGYLGHCMDAVGLEKIEAPGVKMAFRKSSAVVIDGEDLLPAEFMRVKPAPAPEPDKAAISAALKAGNVVPGAHIEHRRSLVIS